MITKERLALNIEVLRMHIPKKPKEHTHDHPLTIKEALNKYSNRRSVNGMESCTNFFNEHYFPLPLWFNPENIKVGFFNKLFYQKWHNGFAKVSTKRRKTKLLKDFNYLWAIVLNVLWFKRNFEVIIIEAFEVNKKYIELRLKSNPLLESKRLMIVEVFKSYKGKSYISSINTLFPLIDYVTRKFLKTKKLSIDVTKICKIFEQNGFGLETANYLMPHITLVNAHDPEKRLSKEEFEKLYEKVKNNNFGIIGSALSSFIIFANLYYGYYKDEGIDSSELNRHAILHGSVNSFGNKLNVIKLITFLYLMLELEPIFDILLNEN